MRHFCAASCRDPLAIEDGATHFQMVTTSRVAPILPAGSNLWQKAAAIAFEEGPTMSGRARLPGGEPRKASQRNSRRASVPLTQITPVWRPGDAVRWQGRAGVFRRDVGDGEHAEIALNERVYRVRVKELA